MRAGTQAVLLVFGLCGGIAHAADFADAESRLGAVEQRNLERMREAGEQACREALDAAGRLGERFRAMSREMTRALSQSSEELAREMVPALRDLADRLNEMARQLERQERSDTI